MTTFLTLGIIGLFAYWVRTLKQEVGSLQQQLFGAGVAGQLTSGMPPSRTGAMADARHGDAGAAESASGEPMRRKSRDTEGGIPTWTLG